MSGQVHLPPAISEAGLDILQRMAVSGIEIPPAGQPQGSYTPWVRTGNLIFIAGQGTRLQGKLMFTGQARELEKAQAAARLCGLNLIAQLNEACGGDLGRVTRVVRLAGVVNSGPDFTDHAAVLNGASDLMKQIFQDKGTHVRMATGASSLPSNMTVEVEGIFEVI